MLIRRRLDEKQPLLCRGVAVPRRCRVEIGDETPAQTGKSLQSVAIYQPGADEITRHMCVCAAEAAIKDEANVR